MKKAGLAKNIKTDIYRCKYAPKSKKFKPGDVVKLIKIPQSRDWITRHSKLGMPGIVVDYGPGVYDFAVYWSEINYKGEPINEFGNRWQMFYVAKEEIEWI